MPNYSTARSSHWPYTLKELSKSAGILFITIFLVSFFITIKGVSYWICSGLLLMWFVGLLDTPRNYKVVIDEHDNTLTQYYRSALSGEGEKIFTVSKMRLYVKTYDASPLSAPNVKALVLYKDHREVVRLDSKKDGFRSETLHEISLELEKLGVPISV